jgi:HK97 family phage major capsid protein
MNAIAPFASFKDFVTAVVAHEVNGAADGRLNQETAASGLNEAVGNLGGFLVPSDFASLIWSRVYATGRILARCDRQPVTKGDKLTVPAISEEGRGDGEQPTGSRFGGAQMYWTDEAGPADDANLKFDLLKFKLHKLLGLVYTSDELTNDAPALAAAILRMFGLEAAFSIEDAIINGDGIAKPLGVLKSPSLITVDKDAAQQAATVSATNLSNMAQRLWGPSHASAIWVMGNDAFGKILELNQANGGGLLEAGPNGQRLLLQMPVELNEYTPALGLPGDILLGDFSQYIVAEKADQMLSSIHVRFVNDESAFKLRYRVDGAPAWTTPITPNNSAVTQSAFVALGARA